MTFNIHSPVSFKKNYSFMYPLGIAIRDFVLLLGVVCAVFATALSCHLASFEQCNPSSHRSDSSTRRDDPSPHRDDELLRLLPKVQFKLKFSGPYPGVQYTTMDLTRGLAELDYYLLRMVPAFAHYGFMPNIDPNNVEGDALYANRDAGVHAELVALEETVSERSIEDGWYARNGPVLQFIASGFMRQEAEITWRWDPPISYAGSKIKLGSDGLLKCYDVPGRDIEPSHVISRGPPAWSPVSLHDVFHQPAPNTVPGNPARPPEGRGNGQGNELQAYLGVGVDVVSTLTNVEKNKGVPLLRLTIKLELSNLHDRLAMITSIIPHDHSYTQDDITLYLSMGQENIETWAAEDLPRLGVQSVLVHEACKIVYQVINEPTFSSAFFRRVPREYQPFNAFGVLPIAAGLAKGDALFRQLYWLNFSIPFASTIKELYGNHAASTSYSTPRDHDPATTNVQPNTDSPPQDPESPLSCPPVERSKWSSDTDDYAMSSDDHDDDSSSSIPSKRLRNKTKPRTKRISGSEGSVAALSAFEPASSSTATAFKIQSNEELLMNISTASGQELDLTFANDSALSLDSQQLALPDSSMQSLGAPSESPVQQSSSVSASNPPGIVSPIAFPDSETHALSTNPLPVAGPTVEESNQLQATSRSLPQQSTSSISMSDSRNRTIKPKHPTSKVSRASYTIENSPVKRNSAFGSVADAIEHFIAVFTRVGASFARFISFSRKPSKTKTAISRSFLHRFLQF
ncbi:hypothetical protein EV360DRAFT_72476 [Lentinula raphanica]|nr:hypothetical protein EV360DRAFT_72476 [Lentinula raphanica]